MKIKFRVHNDKVGEVAHGNNAGMSNFNLKEVCPNNI